jgi:hypothetical protein
MTDRANRQAIDELLAANTDRLIDGERPSEADLSAMPAEARQLWNTIERLARVDVSDLADADMRNRMRVRLNAQWKLNGPAEGQRLSGRRFLTKKSWWMPAMGVIGLAAILLASLLITPAVLPSQSAAANFQLTAFIAGLVILAIIGVIFWWFKRK